MQFEAGWWGFCVYCHALFVDRDFAALAVRVYTLEPLIPAAEAETIYHLVSQAACGGPVLWNEGQDWSVRRFPPEELTKKDMQF
jgi:hypothetical protein